MASDPFDDVFTLEDRFYQQGYQQGVEDGEAAGRIEGRQFGMSTGFDKFLASGQLASRALIWANRLPQLQEAKSAAAAGASASSPATAQRDPSKSIAASALIHRLRAAWSLQRAQPATPPAIRGLMA